MKDKALYLKIIIAILIVVNLVTFKIFSNKNENIVQADFCYYENDNKYILVEKNEIEKSITSYLYKDNEDNFLSRIYEYGTDKELQIEDLIKEEKYEEYNKKINELLDLKYPKFISEVLKTSDGNRSYLLRDNELVIYFNNYEITPNVDEVLYLKVNYNEIKDAINFTVLLDSSYVNESGYDYTNAKKSVAITFDDSPNKNKTNKILNYLSDNHFRATFFVVGEKVEANKDLLINIKNSGNEVGSHTYSHQNMSKMTDTEIINDYEIMNSLYMSVFNKSLTLLRPPYGSIKKSQLDLIDVSFILWSLDTNDWRYRDSNYLINYVINNIKDGDIILFHDSYDSTVSAIEELLPILYSKGYQVMSVSELMDLKGIDLVPNEIVHKAS